MKKKLLIFFVIYAVCAFAIANIHEAPHAAHDDHHALPLKLILWQLLNLTGLVFILGLFLKKKVAAHFEERKNSFTELMTRAETARLEAEKNKKEVSERLAKLEFTAQSSIQQARSEADELRQRIVKEAQELSEKLKEEASRSAHFEIERAKHELRRQLLQSSLEQAQSTMQEKVSDREQKRLQSEFVEKIQVVR